MFDTQITIVGNALNTPEWRRLGGNQTLVAKFKVAATSRRYDREHGRWVDGASLRVRVNCWRRLAENVATSVLSGDPVIVTGRMYTRDWIGDDGQRRVSYELDAVAVGHDLARGQSQFTRHRHALSTTVVDDEQSEARIAGEPTEAVVVRQTPVAQGDTRPEDYSDLGGASVPAPGPAPMPAPAAEGDGRGGDGPGGDGADGGDQTAQALAVLESAGLTTDPFDLSVALERAPSTERDWPEASVPAELVGADRD